MTFLEALDALGVSIWQDGTAKARPLRDVLCSVVAATMVRTVTPEIEGALYGPAAQEGR